MTAGKNTNKPDPSQWFGESIRPGEDEIVSFIISESYSGANVKMPIYVWRGERTGPTVLITAAVHGDELNGTGTIRHIIREQPFDLHAGTLVLVPVVNLLGFERHSRYLPDRRDLNRSFPGTSGGSLASRLAKGFFDNVVKRCDYCIDLHTAAIRRTNFPNIRADLSNERLASFARSFGAELIVNGKGPRGSLRLEANKIGCATIVLEAGEVWKVESGVVEYALRGIENCLKHLGMVNGKPTNPAYRVETNATQWVRAAKGGFLQFHVSPGDTVTKGEMIATNTDLMGDDQNHIKSPRDGIVLGMTTLPSVSPGDPVCNLAYPSKGELKKITRTIENLSEESLHERIRDDLSRGMMVTDSLDE
ncbi:MAG: succinylglutamate desuccinylase/aspartoacylase family protein [Leptolyngbya sp. SIO3F4]|nr:succinylglutamate desuccinylase/aspartoacylase family protein [Leptolyngbya sp. SIO3F4]